VGKTYQIPAATAAIFPPGFGLYGATYQGVVLAAMASQVDATNSVAASNFGTLCNNWLQANMQHRDYELPIDPKPTAPLKQVLHAISTQPQDVVVWIDEKGGATETDTPDAGTMYTWITQDGDPVGVCPDLPAVPARPPGHVHVGRRLAGNYFASCADDTYPSDGPAVSAVSDDSVSGTFQPVGNPFGKWYLKVALWLIAVALAAPALRAQVNLRFTPEPMAVPASVLANARDMGRWTVQGCNDGQAAVTLSSERVDLAAGPLRLIDQGDAMLVLNGHVKRSAAATLLHVLSLAGQGVAIGLSVEGTINNPVASAAMGVGSALIPQITTIVQGEVPSAVPLQSPLKFPLTLQPGQCFTDFRFAARQKNPQVVTGAIR